MKWYLLRHTGELEADWRVIAEYDGLGPAMVRYYAETKRIEKGGVRVQWFDGEQKQDLIACWIPSDERLKQFKEYMKQERGNR